MEQGKDPGAGPFLNLSNNASSTNAPKTIGPNSEPDLEGIEEQEQCRSHFARSHVLLNELTGQVLEINCKSWRCPKHRTKWLHKWKVVVARELEINPANKLITLTLSERCSPAQLNLARQLLMRELRSKYGQFDYLSVLEFTSKTRLPHLHIIGRCPFIPQRDLSTLWDKATIQAGIKSSPVVWIEAPRSQSAAAIYALSYALDGHSKQQDIPDDWHGRKISYSRGFFKAATVKEHWISWIREQFGENEAESAMWTCIEKRSGKPTDR